MPEEKEYAREIYDYLGTLDKTYQKDVSFDSFKSSMSDKKYATDIYSWISSKDESFTKDVPIDDFYSSINLKKKDQAIPIGIAAMPTGSEASAPSAKTDFPISPLENSKTTPPSASTKKGNNTLSFKPDLTIPWDKAPAGSDIYKADKNADYLRVNKPTVAQPVFDQDFEKTFKTLPAVTQVAINKDKELKSEFFNFYKNNPKDIEKFKAWDPKTSLNEATSQSVRQEILQKFYNGVINKYIPRLEELEKSGVGGQLQKAKGFYEDYNKSIDDLKKAKVKLDFYQNNFKLPFYPLSKFQPNFDPKTLLRPQQTTI